MIKHTHGEHGIKSLKCRQFLNTQRQQMHALVIAEQLAHGFKLAEEKLSRIHTDHQFRAFTCHAPHVITAAAADIQNGAPGKRGQMRQNAIPFQIRTPFGINLHTVERERAFTPRHQVAQNVIDTAGFPVGQRLCALCSNPGFQIENVRSHVRQIFNGFYPARIVAVQGLFIPFRNLRGQCFQPVAQALIFCN